MYTPYTLPKNAPRCVFENIAQRTERKGERKGYYYIREQCKHLPEENSPFCVEHAYALEILKLACIVDFPAIAVNQYLSILPGFQNWEAFASRCMPGRVKGITQKLIALAINLEEENKRALKNAVTNSQLPIGDRQESGVVDSDGKMYVPF